MGTLPYILVFYEILYSHRVKICQKNHKETLVEKSNNYVTLFVFTTVKVYDGAPCEDEIDLHGECQRRRETETN